MHMSLLIMRFRYSEICTDGLRPRVAQQEENEDGAGRQGGEQGLVDVAAWVFNIVPSVGIIMINQTLMATHGFAFGTNLSQFTCIGRFTVVLFQVLSHMKTILVLTLGFILFGTEGLSVHVMFGLLLALVVFLLRQEKRRWLGKSQYMGGKLVA
ncbi:hypothetical protein PR202_gb15107 [Eleusine coracana subsp. coracana]|uniref:Sugar phosphate transporter domain-containing protein n=1 Tax=Eleusine coracana subsp. coracana TaxID=191504 RepID=A0AAV5EX41_ELECO|nr:hypothetical protein PR202_gb15107 [Eleusine coracana subsp. coracana]